MNLRFFLTMFIKIIFFVIMVKVIFLKAGSFMEDKIQEEREILSIKRKLIEDELEEKQKNLNNVESKFRALSKEAKGSYNEEKETTEKIYNVLAKDMTSFKEALDAP